MNQLTEWLEELKNDIIEARLKVKEARLNLTKGVIEKKAKAAGKSADDYFKEKFDKLETKLGDISKKISSRLTRFEKRAKVELDELLFEIKKIHLTVRNERREITSGYIEDKTIEALHLAEKKLKKLSKRIEKDMELDSDFNLIRDLK